MKLVEKDGTCHLGGLARIEDSIGQVLRVVRQDNLGGERAHTQVHQNRFEELNRTRASRDSAVADEADRFEGPLVV